MLDHKKISDASVKTQVYKILKGTSKPKAVGLAQTKFRDDYNATPWARFIETGHHYHYVVCVDRDGIL